MCEMVKSLTLSMVEEFITVNCNDFLDILDHQEDDLGGGTPLVGSQPLQRTELYERLHTSMIGYVQRVWECLNGQS